RSLENFSWNQIVTATPHNRVLTIRPIASAKRASLRKPAGVMANVTRCPSVSMRTRAGTRHLHQLVEVFINDQLRFITSLDLDGFPGGRSERLLESLHFLLVLRKEPGVLHTE